MLQEEDRKLERRGETIIAGISYIQYTPLTPLIHRISYWITFENSEYECYPLEEHGKGAWRC